MFLIRTHQLATNSLRSSFPAWHTTYLQTRITLQENKGLQIRRPTADSQRELSILKHKKANANLSIRIGLVSVRLHSYMCPAKGIFYSARAGSILRVPKLGWHVSLRSRSRRSISAKQVGQHPLPFVITHVISLLASSLSYVGLARLTNAAS